MRGWYQRGYIPHVDYPHLWQSITFHLADSVPRPVVARWKRELQSRPDEERERELRRLIDAYEDAGHGSCLLRDDCCAEVVAQQILADDARNYRLAAWVVMPNHVHALIGPIEGDRLDLSATTRRWKGRSARIINQLVDRRGILWQAESYDRWIRDAQHFSTVVRYIADNPVKARLCAEAGQWRWSHAWKGEQGGAG